MVLAFIMLWIYAGVNVYLANRREMRDLNPAGKVFFFFLFLFLWPLFPILVIAGD